MKHYNVTKYAIQNHTLCSKLILCKTFVSYTQGKSSVFYNYNSASKDHSVENVTHFQCCHWYQGKFIGRTLLVFKGDTPSFIIDATLAACDSLQSCICGQTHWTCFFPGLTVLGLIRMPHYAYYNHTRNFVWTIIPNRMVFHKTHMNISTAK